MRCGDFDGSEFGVLQFGESTGIEVILRHGSAILALSLDFSRNRSWNLGQALLDLQTRWYASHVGHLLFGFLEVIIIQAASLRGGRCYFRNDDGHPLMLRQRQRVQRAESAVLVYGIDLLCPLG